MMIESRLLKHPIMNYLFEHKCTCGHIFYEVDSKIPRACPGCGHPNPETVTMGPKGGK